MLLLPIMEIVVFVLVALALGFWAAALLTLLTSALGALLLRLAGRTQLTRFRNSIGIELTADEAGRGLALVLAGILLLLPGFITDLVGLLILLPATRRQIGARVSRWIAQTVGRSQAGAQVVDLDPEEWQSHTTSSQPPSRSNNDPSRQLGPGEPG
jgi:UPF0716 protein FxsA